MGASCVVNMPKEFCRGQFSDENTAQGVVHCNSNGYVKATAGTKTDKPSVDSALEKGEMVHFTKKLP